jgi:hypothetical protein
MTDSEREFATKQLLEGRDAVLRAIAGLAEDQLHFKPRAEDWSIADCVEHLAVTEDLMFALLANGTANPNGVPLDPAKDGRMVAAIVDRSRKVAAPPRVQPHGHFASTAEAAAHFRETRERVLAYASGCTENLRRLFTPHPLLGEIDCYKCLLLLALHPARHAAQIEEIKQHPQFPKG